jgi:flagellar export protein FliJ
MSEFRFRLQKVLELRERLANESATRLAAARTEADRAMSLMKELEQARARGVEKAGETMNGNTSAGELQRIALLIEQLDEHLEAAETAHREAGEKVTDLAGAFERAFTERQVIERLRERKLADWRETEGRADQATMDAVALTRHTRRTNEGTT